jgi:hypothetical protein
MNIVSPETPSMGMNGVPNERNVLPERCPRQLMSLQR